MDASRFLVSAQDGIGVQDMGTGEERGRSGGGGRYRRRAYGRRASPRAAHGARHRQVAGELVALAPIVHFAVILFRDPIAVVPC